MNFDNYMQKIQKIANILENDRYAENIINSKEIDVVEDFQYIVLSSASNYDLVNDIIARLAQNGNAQVVIENLKLISMNMWKDLFNKNEAIKKIFIDNFDYIYENTGIITFREVEVFYQDSETKDLVVDYMDKIIKKISTYDRAALVSLLSETPYGADVVKKNIEVFFQKGEYDISTTYSKILYELEKVDGINKVEILRACSKNLAIMLDRETAIDNETNKLLTWVYDTIEDNKMPVEERGELETNINISILNNFEGILNRANYDRNTIKTLKQFSCTRERFEANKNYYIEQVNKNESDDSKGNILYSEIFKSDAMTEKEANLRKMQERYFGKSFVKYETSNNANDVKNNDANENREINEIHNENDNKISKIFEINPNNNNKVYKYIQNNNDEDSNMYAAAAAPVGINSKVTANNGIPTDKVIYEDNNISTNKVGFDNNISTNKVGFDNNISKNKVAFDNDISTDKVGFDNNILKNKVGISNNVYGNNLESNSNVYGNKFGLYSDKIGYNDNSVKINKMDTISVDNYVDSDKVKENEKIQAQIYNSAVGGLVKEHIKETDKVIDRIMAKNNGSSDVYNFTDKANENNYTNSDSKNYIHNDIVFGNKAQKSGITNNINNLHTANNDYSNKEDNMIADGSLNNIVAKKVVTNKVIANDVNGTSTNMDTINEASSMSTDKVVNNKVSDTIDNKVIQNYTNDSVINENELPIVQEQGIIKKIWTKIKCWCGKFMK